MTLNESSSFVVSSTLSLLLFSGMQVYKVALASTQLLTIVTGFLGAILYVLLLTAVANLEKTVFGFNFQSKLGEVHQRAPARARGPPLQPKRAPPSRPYTCVWFAPSRAGHILRESLVRL